MEADGITFKPIDDPAVQDHIKTLRRIQSKLCVGERDKQACFALGHNLSVMGEWHRALKVYQFACNDLNHMDSCKRLGFNLLKGQGGLKKDPEFFLKYQEKACNGNLNEACHMLASFHSPLTPLTHYGLGKRLEEYKDLEKSMYYFDKGCRLDNAVCCDVLANELLLGELIDKDPEKALECAKKACDGGRKRACEQAASQYRNGEGTEVNEKLADMYQNIKIK